MEPHPEPGLLLGSDAESAGLVPGLHEGGRAAAADLTHRTRAQDEEPVTQALPPPVQLAVPRASGVIAQIHREDVRRRDRRPDRVEDRSR